MKYPLITESVCNLTDAEIIYLLSPFPICPLLSKNPFFSLSLREMLPVLSVHYAYINYTP